MVVSREVLQLAISDLKAFRVRYCGFDLGIHAEQIGEPAVFQSEEVFTRTAAHIQYRKIQRNRPIQETHLWLKRWIIANGTQELAPYSRPPQLAPHHA